jgi:hypothetical protein
MSNEEQRRQMCEAENDVKRIARANPAAVVFAMLDVLVEIACGDNPALRDFKRLQIMRGIRHKLGLMGVR